MSAEFDGAGPDMGIGEARLVTNHVERPWWGGYHDAMNSNRGGTVRRSGVRRARYLMLAGFSLLAMLVVAACTTTAPSAILGVSIDQDDFSLQVGTSATLSVTVEATGGASTAVVWSSDDEGVATVDGDGVVTAVALGSAEITATSEFDDTQSDSVTVTVTTLAVTTIGGLNATLAMASTVDLEWEATNATSIDIVCFDGVDERAIESLGGGVEEANIGIPDSDCQTVRVYARGVGNDADVETVLTGVVLDGNDEGPGSLRGTFASAAPGAIIGFAADVDVVTLVTKDLVAPVDAHMFLDKDIIISGPAGRVTIRSDDTLPQDVSGADVFRSRIFNVTTNATVQLDNLIITGGTFIGMGAGVRNAGDLTITNSLLEGNRAWYYGGAISNIGTLLIEDSELRNNQALVTEGELDAEFLCIDDAERTCEPGDLNYISGPNPGGSGGAVRTTGTTTIVRSTIDGNLAAYSGGGIYVESGTLELVDTDVINNTASSDGLAYSTTSYGGGVQNLSSTTISGGEVSGNASRVDGGGVSNGSWGSLDHPMQLLDVLVTGNAAGVYGGGAVNYYSSTSTPDNLQELGTTSITGNTAGNSGDNRHDQAVEADIVASLALDPETPIVPEDHRLR